MEEALEAAGAIAGWGVGLLTLLLKESSSGVQLFQISLSDNSSCKKNGGKADVSE